MRADDLRWLVAMRSDRDAVGPHNWAGPTNPALQLTRLTGRLDSDGYVTAESGLLIVVDADGTLAGDVTWRMERWGPSAGSACPAIGIALLPSHRGRGIGTDAQRLLVQFLFDTYDVHRVQSDTAADNIAEQRALERAGFQKEGVVREVELRDDRYHDHFLYSVLRREWRDAPRDDVGILQP
jgi:ribosomal-protein-alanine N-acetyltransferase